MRVFSIECNGKPSEKINYCIDNFSLPQLTLPYIVFIPLYIEMKKLLKVLCIVNIKKRF